MTLHPARPDQRTGAIAPLTALFLIVLIGMVAFAVDLGWVVLVQSDLQSAADASALAGANALMDGYVNFVVAADPSTYTILPNGRRKKKAGQIMTSAQSLSLSEGKAAAIAAAKKYAQFNNAGKSSLVLNDSDIELGYVNATGTYASSPPAGEYPNTVRVRMRRDTSANGPLGLFFGPAINVSSVSLSAVAAATIYTAEIDGFLDMPTVKVGMLPMTYDVNDWADFIFSGKGPDGTSKTDNNGVPHLEIYPSIKHVGNFGLLGLDGYNADASSISTWIHDGMSQADVKSLQWVSDTSQTPLIPLSARDPNIHPSQSTDGKGSWNWNGTSGLQTSNIFDLSEHLGKSFLLPLFKPLVSTSNSYVAGNGQGSNYFYNIVQFTSVKIISATNANSGGVIVAASPTVIDFETTTYSQAAPAGTTETTTTSFTFLPPKLTQ